MAFPQKNCCAVWNHNHFPVPHPTGAGIFSCVFPSATYCCGIVACGNHRFLLCSAQKGGVLYDDSQPDTHSHASGQPGRIRPDHLPGRPAHQSSAQIPALRRGAEGEIPAGQIPGGNPERRTAPLSDDPGVRSGIPGRQPPGGFQVGVRSFPNKRILRNNLCLPACKQKNIATKLRDTA